VPPAALVVRADKSYLFVEKAPWTFERRLLRLADALPRNLHRARLAAGERIVTATPSCSMIERFWPLPAQRWLAVPSSFCSHLRYYSFTLGHRGLPRHHRHHGAGDRPSSRPCREEVEEQSRFR